MDEKDSSTNSIRLLQSIEPFSFIQETFLTFVITKIGAYETVIMNLD